MLSRLIPGFILIGVVIFDLIGMFGSGWVSVAFRADGKLCHFPLRECTLGACASNRAGDGLIQGTKLLLNNARCDKFRLAWLFLAGSVGWTIVFLIYMTGTYRLSEIKEISAANFSHCCVGTMKRWYFVMVTPVLHLCVAVLVLIQSNLPLKNFPGYLFYMNLAAVVACAYAGYLLKIDQYTDNDERSATYGKFLGPMVAFKNAHNPFARKAPIMPGRPGPPGSGFGGPLKGKGFVGPPKGKGFGGRPPPKGKGFGGPPPNKGKGFGAPPRPGPAPARRGPMLGRSGPPMPGGRPAPMHGKGKGKGRMAPPRPRPPMRH